MTNTTYSLFIEYNYFISDPTNSKLESANIYNNNILRFDAKVLYHFDQLFQIYSSLKHTFPAIVA